MRYNYFKRETMKIQHILSGIVFTYLISSCSGMYDSVEPYYKEGETNFISKVDSVSTKPGKNRVQISWKVNTDPRIKNLYVTWNNGANEATIPIDFNQLDNSRYCTVILDPVEEGNHIFYLYHTGKGDKSISTEAEAASYGDQYQASLQPRAIRSIETKNGVTTILWRTIVENCEVAITYTNTSGQVASRAVAPSELSTVIDDAQPKSSFKYVSSYLPEKHAMDRFTVTSAELYFPQ